MNNTLIGLPWECLYITHKKRFPLFITMPNSFNIIGVDTLTHLRSRCFHLVNITTIQILLSSLKDLFLLPLSIFNAGWRILQSVSSSFPHIGTDTYFNDFMPMVFSKNSAYLNIYILINPFLSFGKPPSSVKGIPEPMVIWKKESKRSIRGSFSSLIEGRIRRLIGNLLTLSRVYLNI